jgi:hypothetical protein
MCGPEEMELAERLAGVGNAQYVGSIQPSSIGEEENGILAR